MASLTHRVLQREISVILDGIMVTMKVLDLSHCPSMWPTFSLDLAIPSLGNLLK